MNKHGQKQSDFDLNIFQNDPTKKCDKKGSEKYELKEFQSINIPSSD